MCCCRELTLEQILSDPIVETLMQADDVDSRKLEEMLSVVAGKRRDAVERVSRRSTDVSTAARITAVLAWFQAGRKKLAFYGWASVRLLWA